MFMKNCWYVAAYVRELKDGGPFGRTLLGEPVVMFRDSTGHAIALEDRCCHRHLPLSLGQVAGDRVQCGYHGLEFDSSGTCVAVPGQSKVPPGAAVTAFPLVEKYGFLWIWMGEVALADEALLPDWWWVDDPGWAHNPGAFLHIQCNYELITDNLLDLSHLGYVHARTLGNDAIIDFPVKTERLADRVRMSRWIQDRPPPPLFKTGGRFDGTVDRWQIVETHAPAHTVVYAGCGPVGAGEFGGRTEYDDGIHIRALNAPTPETEESTFYFYAHVWDFRIHDADWKQQMYDGFLMTFMEDVDILEAQQASLMRDPDRPLIDLNVDGPGLAA
ncbi:MAG: phenylpropionate dioxygenase-like ring-hydroxylating dioxygenase large terminal subunit, partial [Alphaproteobacteria bacterium]